jgi:PAS domain S-box-containing protein
MRRAADDDRLRRVLAAQHAIAAAGADLERVCQIACEHLLELTGAEGAGVYVLEGGEPVHLVPAGFLGRSGTLRALDGAVLAELHRTKRPLLVRDAKQDGSRDELARRLGIRSQLIVPIGATKPLAQVHLTSRQPDAFAEQDVETVELLSVSLALAFSRTAQADTLSRLSTIFDKASVGIVRWDAQGRILGTNPVFERMLGYAEGELLGVRLRELTHPDDLEATHALARALETHANDRYEIEKRYLRKDGSAAWAQTTAVRDIDAEVGELRGMSLVVDVSERKLAELTLRRNSDRLEQIVETQRDIVVAGHDLPSVLRVIAERSQSLTGADGAMVNLLDGDELVVVGASGVLEPLRGGRRSLAGTASAYAIETGRSFLTLEARSDPRLSRRLVEQTCERSHICVPLFSGERAIGSLNVVSRSDPRPLSEDDRQALELLCVVLSAAMSREAEFDALARFQTVYDSAPLGILVVHRGGKLVEANKAVQDLLGYTADELRGMELDSLIHPDDLEATQALRREVIAGKTPRFEVERRYVRKDGSSVWTDSSVAYVYGQDGQRTFVLTMLQDIDARKAAEEQLRQAQKIEAIGELTAGIAHDFNNLLMGILGYASLLHAEAEEGTRAAEYVDRIEATGRRAATLTQQLLAFGRQQALQLRRLDLTELVAETASMLGRVLGEHIQIEIERDPELRPVRGDPTQIQQVLFNLALNARDAMPSGGKLLIATRNVDAFAASLPTTLLPSSAGYVCLSVTDTGAGMAPHVLERVFEPFFTTKEVGAGSGLGLASVHGIVKQSGGEIEAESRVGVGTTFRIYLPAV